MIALSSEEPLDGAIARSWYQAVKALAPSGTILTLPGIEDGTPRRVAMVHREGDGLHRYVIPLSRDFTDSEVAAIFDEFSSIHPDLDFDLEASTLSVVDAATCTDGTPIDVDRERYLELCTAWAKRQHDAWVKDRSDSGWRVGTTMSLKDKTHPLLKPWDQLPQNMKVVDDQQPQMLLDLLNQQGYAVISKEELTSLLSLMR
jgi:hypothetical protein